MWWEVTDEIKIVDFEVNIFDEVTNITIDNGYGHREVLP